MVKDQSNGGRQYFNKVCSAYLYNKLINNKPRVLNHIFNSEKPGHMLVA